MIADAALQRDRAARLVQQRLHDANQIGLAEVMNALLDATFAAHAGPRGADLPDTPRDAALRRVAHRAVVDRLLALAADTAAAPEVRAMAELKLGEVAAGLRRVLAGGRPAAAFARGDDAPARAYVLGVVSDVERWQTRREMPRPTPAVVAPPGDPFGEDW